VSGLSGDWQRLVVSGTIAVEIRNAGDLDTAKAFVVTLFEDLDRDGAPDPGTDRVLASVSNPGLGALAGARMTAPVSSTVRFRDSPISAFADSGYGVAEFDEENNGGRSGSGCRRPSDPETPAPDLTASFLFVEPAQEPGTFGLGARVGNAGAVAAPAGARVSFTARGAAVGETATGRALAPGDFEDVRVPLRAPARFRGIVTVTIGEVGAPRWDCEPGNDTFSRSIDLAAVGPAPPLMAVHLPFLSVPPLSP